MNLNEAFRYQNTLNELISEGCALLINENVTTRTVVTKKYSDLPDYASTFPGKRDEEEVQEVIALTDVPADYIVQFLDDALTEKDNLCKAIAEAKATKALLLDSYVQSNKQRRLFVSALKRMLSVKTKTRKSFVTEYRTNAEMNQVPFNIPSVSVTSPAFNRTAVLQEYTKHTRTADLFSQECDKLMAMTEVNFTPVFDVNADVLLNLEKWMSTHNLS